LPYACGTVCACQRKRALSLDHSYGGKGNTLGIILFGAFINQGDFMRMMNLVLILVASMFYQSVHAIPPEAPGGDSNSTAGTKKSSDKKSSSTPKTRKESGAKPAKGSKK
jgi:hypothetical protein